MYFINERKCIIEPLRNSNAEEWASHPICKNYGVSAVKGLTLGVSSWRRKHFLLLSTLNILPHPLFVWMLIMIIFPLKTLYVFPWLFLEGSFSVTRNSFKFNHEKFASVARHLDVVLWKLLNTTHKFLSSLSIHIERWSACSSIYSGMSLESRYFILTTHSVCGKTWNDVSVFSLRLWLTCCVTFHPLNE